MNGANRTAVLIGHSGFLGTALAAAIQAHQNIDATLIGGRGDDFVRRVLEGKGREAISPLLARDGVQDWICAVGIVDPQADAGLIDAVNVDFPRQLYASLAVLAPPGAVRLVTVGSVLEGHGELATSNAYLASKSRMFEVLCSAGEALRWHHIRLHTLYGGSRRPHPFMFAGQMFDALVRKEPFKMSGGTQVREYHHADDVAASILAFLAGSHRDCRIVELNSGEPIRLRELASAVFAHFGAGELLEIGARVHSSGEVFESAHRRSPYLTASRDPVQGVIGWFKELGVVRS